MAVNELRNGAKEAVKNEGVSDKVPLESLSELTGFPVEFIKKELLLNKETLSMDDLRKSMAIYLENTVQELQA